MVLADMSAMVGVERGESGRGSKSFLGKDSRSSRSRRQGCC